MSRYAFLAAALIAVLPGEPCLAVDAKQKIATCTFGADKQRLQGEAREAFPQEMHGGSGRSARPSARQSRQNRAQAIAGVNSPNTVGYPSAFPGRVFIGTEACRTSELRRTLSHMSTGGTNSGGRNAQRPPPGSPGTEGFQQGLKSAA
jgi:hypothetical protein